MLRCIQLADYSAYGFKAAALHNINFTQEKKVKAILISIQCPFNQAVTLTPLMQL